MRGPPYRRVPADSIARGLYVATRRNAGEDRYYWRVTQWLMPCFSFFPPYGDNAFGGHAFVPIDDENCWTFSIDYHPRRPLSEAEREAMHAGKGVHVRLAEGTFTPDANRRNDYRIDRAAQKARQTFSGVLGVGVQDAAVQESMGAIQDRARENLVSSDNKSSDAQSAVELPRRAANTAPPGLAPKRKGRGRSRRGSARVLARTLARASQARVVFGETYELTLSGHGARSA